MPTYIGTDVTAFTIGGSAYLDDVIDATLTPENRQEESKGVADRWDEPQLVGSGWNLEVNLKAGTTPKFPILGTATGSYAVGLTTTYATYTGTAVLLTAAHEVGRDAIQKVRVSMKGYGSLVVA